MISQSAWAGHIYKFKYRNESYAVNLEYGGLWYSSSLDETYRWQKKHGTLSQHAIDNIQKYAIESPNQDAIHDLAFALDTQYGPFDNHLSFMNYLLAFVNSFPYKYDIDNYGIDDYWATPYETIYRKYSDCEDRAFLYASLLHHLCYDVLLVELTGHMACGVETGFLMFPPEWMESLSKNGRKYYYAETTMDGNENSQSHEIGKTNELLLPRRTVEIFSECPPRSAISGWSENRDQPWNIRGGQ